MKRIILIISLMLPILILAQEIDNSIYGIEGFYDVQTNEGREKVRDYLKWRIQKKGDELTKLEAEKVFNPKTESEFEVLKKSVARFENPELFTYEESIELLKGSKYKGYLEENIFIRAENEEPKYVFPKGEETNSSIVNDESFIYLGILIILVLIFLVWKFKFNK